MRRRLRPLLLAPLALAAGGLTATALAVPPGGPVENPLGATVTLAQTTVPATGVLTVSATGYDPSEHVSLKLDDGAVKDKANSDVLATADAAADGTFTTTVDLAKAATPLAGGTHAVRLLSAAAAGARSIHVDFTVPASPTGTTTTATTTTTTGTTTTPTATTGVPVSATAPSVASTALRAAGGKVALRLRGGTTGLKGKASLRVKGGVTLARAVSVAVPAKATKTVRFTLTAAGRAQVRRHARLAVVVAVMPSTGAKAFKKSLTLKRVA